MQIKGVLILMAGLNGFYPHFIEHDPIVGIVEQGRQEARKLGFPTANIRLEENALLSPGVYCGTVELHDHTYKIMGYLDPCNPQIFEAHLFNFVGNLYGKTLIVYLTYFVRYPMDFGDDKTAKGQIKKDAAFCLKHG